MAFTIPRADLSTLLSEGLSRGAQRGLSEIAENRKKERSLQQEGSALSSIGLPESLAGADPRIQQEALKRTQNMQENRGLADLLGGAGGGADQTQEGPDQSSPQSDGRPDMGPAEKQAMQAVQNSAMSPEDALRFVQQAKEQDLEAQKQERAETERAFKETKEERKDILQQARAAEDANNRLNRMQRLSDQGKLTPSFVERGLQAFGIDDVSALRNPESEEFKKLRSDFVKDAKSYFPGRMTNTELMEFLKSIPDLLNSPEGINRVIKNMRLVNEGKILRSRMMRDIISENAGRPPDAITEKIDDRMDRYKKALASQFTSDYVPYSEFQEMEDTTGTFPSPADLQGGTVRDHDTGILYESDGIIWRPVYGENA